MKLKNSGLEQMATGCDCMVKRAQIHGNDPHSHTRMHFHCLLEAFITTNYSEASDMSFADVVGGGGKKRNRARVSVSKRR